MAAGGGGAGLGLFVEAALPAVAGGGELDWPC